MTATAFPEGGGDSATARRSKRLGLLLLLALLLAFIPATYLVVRRPTPYQDQPSMGPDPCDMGFIGVRKDYGDTLYGAKGERLGFDPAVNIYRTHWTQDSLQREFIFEVPVADDSFKIAQPVRIYLNGHRGYSPRPRTVLIKSQHSTRFIVDTALPRLSLRSKSALAELQGGEPVRFVDVEIAFYAGPRPPAEVRFVGPFGQDQSMGDEHGRGYILRTFFRQLALNTTELRLYVTTQNAAPTRSPLLLYLADGTLKVIPSVGQEASASGTTLHYVAPDISREQLLQVTYGEHFFKKTFSGIAVEYQSKGRSCAAYLDAFCERLGLFPSDRDAISQRLYRPAYQDPNEALEVLDVVRGRAILPVCHTIRRRLSPQSLPPNQRTRVRDIARQWLGTELENEGIALGLWGNWPEFVKPALQQLQWTRFERDTQRDLANAFRYRDEPRDEELQQVAEYLIRRKTKSNQARSDLIEFIRAHTHRPAGLQAYKRLLACDRPWVWASLIVPDAAFSRLVSQGDLSDTVKRRALALGVDCGDLPEGQTLDDARAQLAQWISPEFVQKDVAQYRRVMTLLARHGLPERDTPALIQYLEQQLRLWTAYRPRRGALRAPLLLHSHTGVEKAIKCLNAWHAMNLAGLGRDLSQACSKDLCDWRNVARTALHWARTGQDPDRLPPGWQAADHDIRIIWHNTAYPEQSRISLWSRGRQRPGLRLHLGLKLAGHEVLYSLYLSDALDGNDLRLNLSAGLPDETPTTLSYSFTSAELPSSLALSPVEQADGDEDPSPHWLSPWAVSLEPARAEKSVLSGTQLFQAWRAIYGNETPTDRSLPCSFMLD